MIAFLQLKVTLVYFEKMFFKGSDKNDIIKQLSSLNTVLKATECLGCLFGRKRDHKKNYLFHNSSFSFRKCCVSSQFIIDKLHFYFYSAFCLLSLKIISLVVHCIEIVNLMLSGPFFPDALND